MLAVEREVEEEKEEMSKVIEEMMEPVIVMTENAIILDLIKFLLNILHNVPSVPVAGSIPFRTCSVNLCSRSSCLVVSFCTRRCCIRPLNPLRLVRGKVILLIIIICCCRNDEEGFHKQNQCNGLSTFVVCCDL